MRQQKSTITILMFSLILMILITGCKSIKLYPLDQKHIVPVKEGEKVTAPKDGYFLSNEYFKKILKAKVEAF